MKVHIISIFPESFDSYFNTSILKNAQNKGNFEFYLYKLNDFSSLPTKRVDDKAFGMHGQVISAEPLSKSINYILDIVGVRIPIIYMSPKGDLLKQEKVEEYSELLGEEFIIICGHYEGIDQRIIDLYVDYEISIGEYILTSGEIASMVLIDSLIRLKPNVIGKKISHEEESFSKKLNRQKEYPVYTRPREFEDIGVPDILLSGNHPEIEKWKNNNLT